MDNKVLHRSFATLAFVISLGVYLATVQPTVPFWDCGEFTAAAIDQQVPHPPGAPLFLLIGKVFHTIIPFGDPGWRVNLVSVFSSAISVLLLYLITVQVLNNLRGTKPQEFAEALAVFGSAFVGAMAFTFSDTFWFNAVESEVYAASTLFVAIIVYLMMRWNEEADNPGHERYLLLIAYVIGLSTGVHLLSILTVFSIVMLVYFRKYEINLKSFLIMGSISVVLFFLIYPGIVKWFPALLGGKLPFRNEAREYILTNALWVRVLGIGLVAAAGYGLWWFLTQKKRAGYALVCTVFLFMIVGYSTYTQILLRSNANPPMNENEPKDLSKLVAYLGREQYGEAPFWPRRHRTESHISSRHRNYGEWYEPEYVPVRRKDGVGIRIPEFRRINTAGEFNYLWSYQISHMYIRYFMWNFVGRQSDVQDAKESWFSHNMSFLLPEEREKYLNYKTGFGHLYPVRFYGIPLLIGLIGLFFHAMHDKRMAAVFFVMFLTMGVLAAIQQNQQNPQPRERDYFYVGSFMVFCLWIGMGVYGILMSLAKQKFRQGMVAAVIGLALIAVPFNMAIGGWKTHSRKGNYLPFDYAYNILQSVEQDAIVFTNGDNDTFPVWYLQDVAGVRRDVRIVNLSLGNTLWYVDQLKNQRPWGAKKIPLSFSDESLRVVNEYDPKALSFEFGEAQNISIPVDQQIMAQFTSDPALLEDGHMRWKFFGEPHSQREGKQIYVFRVQDFLVHDILRTTKFERPVYYSMSVGPDAYCGLEDFFRMEGMALRICPVPISRGKGRGNYAVNEEIMDKTALNILPFEQHETQQHFGLKFRNLNDEDTYYDESNRRPVSNYRSIYVNYAYDLMLDKNKPEKAARVLDTMNYYISPEKFPLPFAVEYQMAEMYNRCGAGEQAKRFARLAVNSSQQLIEDRELWNYEYYTRSYNPFIVQSQSYELLEEYDNAIATLRTLQQTEGVNDPTLEAQINQLEISKFESQGKYIEALDAANKLIQKYSNSQERLLRSMVNGLQRKVIELRQKAGLPEDTAATTDGDIQ